MVFGELHQALEFIQAHQLTIGLKEDIVHYENDGVAIAWWRYVPSPGQNGLHNWSN
jgi:hypothetical protein